MQSHTSTVNTDEAPNQSSTNGRVTQVDQAFTQEYKLREYGRLTSELEKQMDRRDRIDDRVQQVAGFCATGAGIMATIGGIVGNPLIQLIGASISLSSCPILLAFHACQREQIDLRIGQLQWQIRHRHECPNLQGEGWEDSRHDIFGKRPWFPALSCWLHPNQPQPIYHELAARRGLSIIASLGMFITIEILYLLGAILCSVLAFQKEPPLPCCVFLLILLAMAALGILLTLVVMQHKRHQKKGNDQ